MRNFVFFVSIMLAGCASNNEKDQLANICEQYSNAYMAASMMRENKLTMQEAKVCAVAGVTEMDQLRICEGGDSLTADDIALAKSKLENAKSNPSSLQSTLILWMVSVVDRVYNNPEIKTHQWKMDTSSSCGTINNV